MVASWLYFLGDDKNPTELFLYGLSLSSQVNKSMNLSLEKVGKIQSDFLGTKKIYLFKSINDFSLSDVICGNKIKLHTINSKLSSDIEFSFYQNVIRNPKDFDYDIPESPISTTIELSTYFVDQIKPLINNHLEKRVITDILNILQKDTNLKFTKGYSRNLGCYELALTLPTWAETEVPFSLKIKEEVLKFEREKTDDAIFLHTIIYKNKEIIYDRIITLSKGEKTYSFPSLDLDDFEYWVFDNNGNPLHHEHLALIRQIVGGIHTLGNTVTITNKSKSISVTPVSTSSLTVNVPRTISDVEHSYRIQTMHNIVNENNNSSAKQKFFTKSCNPLKNVVEYVNSFIDDECSEVYFIDPFISPPSLLPICGINKIKTKITVISAYKNLNPDDDSEKIDIENLITNTKNALLEISGTGIPASNLIWFNLKNEVFHDRFIYIKNRENYTILSLSNSLNNLLGKYNLSIFEFNDMEKISVQKYLEEIINKADNSNQVYPVI